MKDERLVSKMEGEANFSRRLIQSDGLTGLIMTPPPLYFTTDLRHRQRVQTAATQGGVDAVRTVCGRHDDHL